MFYHWVLNVQNIATPWRVNQKTEKVSARTGYANNCFAPRTDYIEKLKEEFDKDYNQLPLLRTPSGPRVSVLYSESP